MTQRGYGQWLHVRALHSLFQWGLRHFRSLPRSFYFALVGYAQLSSTPHAKIFSGARSGNAFGSSDLRGCGTPQSATPSWKTLKNSTTDGFFNSASRSMRVTSCNVRDWLLQARSSHQVHRLNNSTQTGCRLYFRRGQSGVGKEEARLNDGAIQLTRRRTCRHKTEKAAAFLAAACFIIGDPQVAQEPRARI